MPKADVGFAITQRFKDLGYDFKDRHKIAARLEKEGGAKPGEYVIDAAYRVAEMMVAEAKAATEKKEEPAEAPSNGHVAPADEELIPVTITVNLTRRQLSELFRRAA